MPAYRPVRAALGRILLFFAAAVATFYGICFLSLIVLKFADPPFTMVHVQRRVEAAMSGQDYEKRYRFVPVSSMSRHLLNAVVAAEDSRFFQHRGIDWEEMQIAREQASIRGTAPRGASTITQQVVKNLFLTTHRSYVRKGIEFTLVYPTEFILGKDRILELYVNIVEWGDGIYGAEAASQYHYGISSSDVTRAQAARLAACLPAPRTRRPQQMGWYSSIILKRMASMGM